MAATVELKVNLEYQSAYMGLLNLERYASELSKKPYDIRINIRGIEQLKEFQGLSKELNALARWQQAQNKADEVSLKKQIEAQKELARLERENAKAAKENNSRDSYLNSSAAKYDAEIKAAEASSRRFADAIKAQMQSQIELENSNKRLASSYNEYDQSIAKREAEGYAFSAALKQQMQAEQEAGREAKLAGQSMQEAGNAAAQSGSAAASGAGGWSVLGGAIASALGHLASRALMAAWSKVTQGVRDALTEMKNVDTELTNISKVSGKTGEELAAIGDRAYETASRYGESASTYLEAVYSMQKAGMGDMSENMGELAIKTMLVGDTTQDVATKFLLSANAAWKLEGNMDRLTQIVDEADYINNNYATSLDKLAAGMPIVASIAAQTGMTAEETMAAIGTITAATQESGTKAATALRALILNISGEVGKYLTEEGEEFEVTEESVKSMQGLLEKYAKTEMDAARAAGEMIDPMTAIQAIFKGMAEDDLSDVELFNLLSGMGGKLRTNQLTALVQNFETLYKEMMDGMKGAAGTADKEIDLMMDSWERKSQKLKNTWTEFISDIVSSDTIKGGLDWLTELIDKADGFIEKWKSGEWAESDSLAKQYEAADKEMKDLESRSGSLTGAEERRLAILREITAELQAQLGLQRTADAEETKNNLLKDQWTKYDSEGYGTAPMRMSGDQATLNTLFGQYRDAATAYTNTGDITSFQSSLKGIVADFGNYYNELVRIKDAGVELTDSQQQFVDQFAGIQSAASATITDVKDLGDGMEGLYDSAGNLVAVVQSQAELEEETRERAQEAQEEQQAEIAAFEEAANAFDSTYSTAAEMERQQLEALQNEWNNFSTAADDTGDALGTSAENAGAVESASAGAQGSIDAATGSANALAGALAAAASNAQSIHVDPIAVGAAAEGTKNAPGGLTLVNELGPELISDNGRAYIANGGRPGIVNLSRGAIVLTAKETREAMRGNRQSRAINAAASGVVAGSFLGGGTSNTVQRGRHGVPIGSGTVTVTSGGHIDLRTYNSALNGVESVIKMVKETGSGGGGGGKSAKKIAEELADETKDILSNLEKQAKLADNRKQYEKEAQLYQKAQAQIDKQVAAYKKAGYKETDDEILDLLNKRFDYDKKIDTANKKTIKEAADELKDKLSNLDKQAKLADTEGDYLKEVQFYESAQEAIKEMVERYRKAGYKDDSTEIVELLQKNYDYADKQVSVYKDRWNELIDALETDTEQQELANKLAEKEQALLDAQEALSNATGQRTIRTYNASTGQWEWVADQSKIKSAQESLTKAEESYAEEVKDQAIQELEQLRDTMADLNDVILGPALSAIMMKAESSDEFQNFARALNAVYGVGSYLSSTEGSSNVISTANDSHDTIYSFGNVTLTEEQASNMSVAQLAQKLQVLKIS